MCRLDKIKEQDETLTRLNVELNVILDHEEGQIDVNELSAKVDEICRLINPETTTFDDVEEQQIV